MFLKQVGLTGIPEILSRIEVARHMGVTPDWFAAQPRVWYDWGLISLDIHNNLATPAKKE